jgi:threonine dehydratase
MSHPHRVLHDANEPEADLTAMGLPDLAQVLQARDRIAAHVHRTPTLHCASIDATIGAQLFFKCENFQKIGAFKARGATNAVFALDAGRAARGVVTHSSGNHGAALAYAARRRGIPAWVVMPENAPRVKIDNVAGQGATIRFCAANVAAREATCAEVERESGATLIHPFDNREVIAGQATAALELLRGVPDLDLVIAPCGGGGLLAGTAIVAKALLPALRVFGAEPANADDAQRSLTTRQVEPLPATLTIADGLRTTLAPRTLAAIVAHVEAIGTCSEEAIVAAMRITWERMKIVIEPSSAVPLACLLERTLEVAGRRAGIIVSGGNVDLDWLPWQLPR